MSFADLFICLDLLLNVHRVFQGREGTSTSTSGSQTTVSNNGWTTVQHSGPGWQSTVYTFGDSSDPGVLTLHNLLGHSNDRREQLPSENNIGGAHSDVRRLLQQLQQDFSSPQLQLAGAGARDFTEVGTFSLCSCACTVWPSNSSQHDSIICPRMPSMKILGGLTHSLVCCRRTMRCCLRWIMGA